MSTLFQSNLSFFESEFGWQSWTKENWQGVGLSTVVFLFALILVFWIGRSSSSNRKV